MFLIRNHHVRRPLFSHTPVGGNTDGRSDAGHSVCDPRFVRRPAFALSAILSLAIGIAATSAVFGIINGLLFKPIRGVTRPERLVEIARDVNGEFSDVT